MATFNIKKINLSDCMPLNDQKHSFEKPEGCNQEYTTWRHMQQDTKRKQAKQKTQHIEQKNYISQTEPTKSQIREEGKQIYIIVQRSIAV